MADDSDKKHDPTPRRLQKAREEGNVLKSQDVTAVGMLIAGVSVLAAGTPLAFNALRNLMAFVFLGAVRKDIDLYTLPQVLTDLGFRVVWILAPFFAVLIVSAIALNVLQSGFHPSSKGFAPKGSRLNPATGLKRIFSTKGAVSLLKSLLKVALVAPIAYLNIKKHLPDLLMLHTQPLESILTEATGWIMAMVIQMLTALAVISAADFFYEKWQYKKNLKMSDQEVKDETKDQDGNPEVKSKRRAKAMEISRRGRLDHAVLKADVVVTNPTHYAVALRYDPSEADAPRVVAKGIRKRALRIKELARQLGVPTVEDRPLARALYAAVEEEQMIPEELYPAVAALLAEIFRQRGK